MRRSIRFFSFLSTLSDGDDALYEYEFFPEPERAAIFEPLRGDLPGIGTDTLLRTRRPNVVLFLVESFGRSTVDERVGGEPVAPEFQRLKGEGVYFDNLFANSFRTDRGTVAVLSGFPAQTKMSVMKLPVKSQRLPRSPARCAAKAMPRASTTAATSTSPTRPPTSTARASTGSRGRKTCISTPRLRNGAMPTTW